jgi:LuxR family maltose regulon positive regulatory protein
MDLVDQPSGTASAWTVETLVPRPRLSERLREGLACSLTVIQAPAGYGKSALLALWQRELEASGLPVSLLAKPDAATLLGAMERRPPGILLIDGLEAGAEPVLTSALSGALPPFPMILAVRSRAPLRLARLRATGRLLEVGAEELRLDQEEVTQLHRALSGRAAAAHTLTELQARSQGWPLAVALHARASRRDRAGLSLHGEHRLLFEYFGEEVLAGLPTEMRAFLLRIAVPGRICARLCDALLEEEGSQAKLDEMVREGLFLQPLDQKRLWYRLHPLFLEYLRRLLKDEEPALANRLTRRAAAWFHAQGLDLEAGQHAFLSGDARRAYRLLEQVCRDVSAGSHEITDLVTPAGARRLLAFPDLVLSICWVLCNRWQFRLVHELLALLEPRIREMARGRPAERQEAARLDRLLRHRRMMQALFEDRTALAAERAGNLLPELQSLHPYVRASVQSTLLHAERDQFRMGGIAARDEAARRECDQTDRIQGLIWHGTVAGSARFAAGDVDQAKRTLAETAVLAAQETELPWLAAIPAVLLAEIHLERNELREAQALIEGSLPALRHGMVEHLIAGHGTAAQLNWIAGRHEDAFAVMDAALRLAATHDFPRLRYAIAALRLRCLTQLGALSPALRVAREMELDPAGDPPLPRRGATGAAEMHAMAWARAAMTTGHASGALQVSARWCDFTARAGAVRSAVRWSVLAARLEVALGEERAAQRRLRRALLLAAPAGFARPFLDEGEAVLELLGRQVGTGPSGGTAVDAFLASILHRPEKVSVSPSAPGAGVTGGLTAMEAEVAQLASAGLRNREIGTRLGLTEGSVKWYLQRIFDKAGVRRRASVAERARAAGLMG